MTKNWSAVQPRRQGEQPCRDVRGMSAGKWEAFGLLKDLTCHFGLNSSDLLLLEKHLAVVPDVEAPTLVRVSFQSQTSVCRAANGMAERTARRCEAKLEALGFLKRKRSGNGRRYPDRHAETGQIVGGYGIDLQPFFDRIPEIIEAHKAQEIATRERASALSQVSSLLSELKRLSADNMPKVDDLARAYHNLRRRASAGLKEIEALLFAVKGALKELAGEAPCPIKSDSLREDAKSHTSDSMVEVPAPACCEQPTLIVADAVEMLPQEQPSVVSEQPPAHTQSGETTTLPRTSTTSKMTAAAGQNVRRTESNHPKDSKTPSSELSASEAWSRCSNLAEFFLEAPRSDIDAKRIAYDACGFFGVRKDTIAMAVAGFGSSNLLLILDYLTPKAAELSNPSAYLASMLRKFEAGEAVAGGRVRPGKPRKRRVVRGQQASWAGAGIHHLGSIV